MTKYFLGILFAAFIFIAPQSVDAAAFYIDFQCADTGTCGNGTATTTSFSSLDQFTEVARTAGDIAFVRRGVASTTNMSALTFTSDGTLLAPLMVSADYDNLWNDFADSAQTYTVNAATTTLYANTTITGISAGDWIYVSGDCTETYNSTVLNPCEYSFEVRAITDNALLLWRPYDGNQSGSGLTLRVLPDLPIWSTTNGSTGWTFGGDAYWLFKGIDFRASNPVTTCSINIGTADVTPIYFMDMIFQSDDNTDCLFSNVGISTQVSVWIDRSRVSNWIDGDGFVDGADGSDYQMKINKTVFQNAGNMNFNGISMFMNESIYETDDLLVGANSIANNNTDKVFRNIRFVGAGNLTFTAQNAQNFITANDGFEDLNGVIGDNRLYNQLSSANDIAASRSTTTASALRSGGGPVSLEVIPSTSLNILWPFGQSKLFEYPIYSDGSSKQYDIYFMSPSDTWTTNPTASQLWIECDYWAHDTNATSTRKTKKSTGTVDFNGSTAWQSLSVTCDPSQAGILYLRGWYGKAKEAGTNLFFVDPQPVIN